MSVIKCCLGCEERRPACHDTCQKYNAEKTESLKAREKRMKFNKTEYDIHSIKKRKKK